MCLQRATHMYSLRIQSMSRHGSEDGFLKHGNVFIRLVAGSAPLCEILMGAHKVLQY